MQCFLLLLLLPIGPAVTEVVTSMSDCANFFLQQTPPQIPGILEGGSIQNQNGYKAICQTLRNARTFVTLYDTNNKIPVFSAGMYRGKEASRPNVNWKIEPQLEDLRLSHNMGIENKKRSYRYQAVNADYKNQTSFDRGHLLPSSYGLTKRDSESTFTLTNIVPQEGTFNKGSWNSMENCIRCVLDEYCINNNGHQQKEQV
ncbi:endonuclease G, mitochondrial-like [Seriola lalandi dorsalis]|uniref:endonuclease G, mitochondrial-like n=1 Tax=Seriola lalandi dorsalis TaxID=1841481 RepID=UPI000C6F7AC2|nr:endonuclease G, mitochondrial-like [Seriola lalandi dorsalis]